MQFQIRRAHPGDAPHIAHVHVESWKTTYRGIVPDAHLASLSEEARRQRWQEAFEENLIHIFVAEDDAGIFGFISGGAIRDPAPHYDGELYAIYLLRPRQRQGVGRALTHALASALHAQGLKSMLVWALEANPAVEFYKRLGAVPVSGKRIDIGGKDLSDLSLGWPSLDPLL